MRKQFVKLSALALVIITLVGMVACGFSYMEDDLSVYATLDKEKLANIIVTIPTAYEVTEEDIDEIIRQNLFAKKTYVNGGKYETVGTLGDGDNIRLWYSGIVTEEEGKETPIRDEASKKTFNNTPLWSVVGAGSLRIEELETKLNGVKIEDYLTVRKGTIKADAIYFMYYHYTDYDADGKIVGGATFDGVNRIPASELDETLSPGFKAKFDELVVGKEFDMDKNGIFEITLDGDFGKGAVKRTYAIRMCGQSDRDLLIEGSFKEDGGTYAGKPVKLYVQLFEFVDYEVPELNAETAVSLFKIDKDNPDPVAEFRRQAENLLLEDSGRVSAINTEIHKALEACVTVHDLPREMVKESYKAFMKRTKHYWKQSQSTDEMKAQFAEQFGKDAVESFDNFAAAMLNGKKGESAEDIAWVSAEAAVREDVIIYTLVRYSGLDLPSNDVIETRVNNDITEAIKETGATEEELYDAYRPYGGRGYFTAKRYTEEILKAMFDQVKIEYKDLEK